MTDIITASFGIGVSSVAGILNMGIDYFDEIIFADTLREKRQTYDYLRFLMEDKHWPITIVKSKYGDIFDYYYKKRRYPNLWNHDCSQKFKIDVMHKYLRTKYGKSVRFYSHVFYEDEEWHRMKVPKVKYESLVYPLIEASISREQCIEIIKADGYPIPPKSGCYFCPFTPPEQWIWLRDHNPAEFAKAHELEANSTLRLKRKYPLISLKASESKTLFQCGCF